MNGSRAKKIRRALRKSRVQTVLRAWDELRVLRFRRRAVYALRLLRGRHVDGSKAK